jgi:hypothetical protein
MKLFNFLFLLSVVMFLGCSSKPSVRVDMDTYLRNTGQYSGENIIFTASIEDLQKRYELYKDREVEVAGVVLYYGDKNFWTWYILLEKDGKSVRCYAHQYRVEPGRDALHMVRWVQSDKGELTVQGKLRNDGIEIRYMRYKGDTVTPYYKPTDHLTLPYSNFPLIR